MAVDEFLVENSFALILALLDCLASFVIVVLVGGCGGNCAGSGSDGDGAVLLLEDEKIEREITPLKVLLSPSEFLVGVGGGRAGCGSGWMLLLEEEKIERDMTAPNNSRSATGVTTGTWSFSVFLVGAAGEAFVFVFLLDVFADCLSSFDILLFGDGGGVDGGVGSLLIMECTGEGGVGSCGMLLLIMERTPPNTFVVSGLHRRHRPRWVSPNSVSGTFVFDFRTTPFFLISCVWFPQVGHWPYLSRFARMSDSVVGALLYANS